MESETLTLYKLIVLYMLDSVKFKLTYSQISEFILDKEYMNFMTLQQVITDLQESGLIQSYSMSSKTFYSITPEGQKTLSYFGSRIGWKFKSDIDRYLYEKRLELRNESSIAASFCKNKNGEYDATLIATEKYSELINIKIPVPTEEMAQRVCDNWYSKNQEVYKYLMETLL